MYRVFSKTSWFFCSLVILLVGGLAIGLGQHRQNEVREELVMLDMANHNLALVVQARIDRVLDRPGLTKTPSEDEDVAERVEAVRSRTDRVDEDLDRILELLNRVDAGDLRGTLFSLTVALINVRDGSMTPVRMELSSAVTRTWWAIGLTGAALAALLVVEVRRPED